MKKTSNYKTVFETVETHTLGEPTRIILSGFPKPEGHSLMEYKEYYEQNFDDYRKALMAEPRGHRDMVGALLIPPLSPSADLGVIYMDANRWINMCGHATIGTAMCAVNLEMVEVQEPVTALTLETPAGLVEVSVQVKNKKAQSVSFINVPSFLYKDGCSITLDGKDIHFAISYAGSFFALAEAGQFEKPISLRTANEYCSLGMRILEEINKKYKVQHPLLPISAVANIEFYQQEPNGQKNIVVSQEGQIDRSPCGTGTSAKLAYMYAKVLLQKQEPFVNKSFTGVSFTGEVVDETTVGAYQAVIPRITGQAYISGFSTFVIDEDDPLKWGFNL